MAATETKRTKSEGWTCKSCTYINTQYITNCAICTTTREYKWKCKECNFLNNGDKCENCDKRNSDVEHEKFLERPKVMRNPDDTWNCPRCTMLNISTSTSCSACRMKDQVDMVLDMLLEKASKTLYDSKDINSHRKFLEDKTSSSTSEAWRITQKLYNGPKFDVGTSELKNYAVITLLTNIIYVSIINLDGIIQKKPHKITDYNFKPRLANAIKYICNWKDESEVTCSSAPNDSLRTEVSASNKFRFSKIAVAYTPDQDVNCIAVWLELQPTELATIDCSKMIELTDDYNTVHQDDLFEYICRSIKSS